MLWINHSINVNYHHLYSGHHHHLGSAPTPTWVLVSYWMKEYFSYFFSFVDPSSLLLNQDFMNLNYEIWQPSKVAKYKMINVSLSHSQADYTVPPQDQWHFNSHHSKPFLRAMAVKGRISCVIETFGWRAGKIILLFCEDMNLNPWNPHKSWTLQQLQLKGGRWRQEDSPKLEGQLTWCTSQLWTTKSTCLKQAGRGWLIPKVGLQHLYTWMQKDKQRIKKWI